MKSRFEADSLYSNTWLRMHGYAMGRFGGRRKHMSIADCARLPFGEIKPKYKRYMKRQNKTRARRAVL